MKGLPRENLLNEHCFRVISFFVSIFLSFSSFYILIPGISLPFFIFFILISGGRLFSMPLYLSIFLYFNIWEHVEVFVLYIFIFNSFLFSFYIILSFYISLPKSRSMYFYFIYLSFYVLSAAWLIN